MQSKQHAFQFNTSIAFPISALILLILVLLAINSWQTKSEQLPSNSIADISPAPQKINPFHLTTTDNKEFSQKNFIGHWTLLYFGYTRSNTTCPNALSLLNRAYNILQTEHPTLRVLFVSLDPERDTLNDIKDFTTSFNKFFLGATGTLNELQNLKSQLGINTKHFPTPVNNVDYQINETNKIFLINPQAALQATIPTSSKLDEIRIAFEDIVDN